MTEQEDKTNPENKENRNNPPSPSSESEQPKGSDTANNSTDQKNNGNTPIINNIIVKEDSRVKWTDKSNAIFTALLFIATGVLAWYTISLVGDNKKLINETINKNKVDSAFTAKAISQTERSITIAKGSDSANDITTKTSLELTSKNLELARKNFAIESRPYVYIKDFSFDDIIKVVNPKVRGQLINVGKTQALNLRYFTSWDFHTVSQYYGNYKLDSIEHRWNSLPPTTPYLVSFDALGSRDSIFVELINNKKFYLYFFGKLFYTDIFKNDYWTEFCIIYDPQTPNKPFLNATFNDMK